MARVFLVAIVLIASIAQIESAVADPQPRSRLITAMLERFAEGYQSFCFIGMEVSHSPKSPIEYRPVALAPSFYERFVEGRFDTATIKQLGCPKPENKTDTCQQGCVTIMVFDFAGLGYPTPWTPWPKCEQEQISIVRSHTRLPGKLVLAANIYRNGLVRGSDLWGHNYIMITETAPCRYLIQDEEVIE